MKIRLGACKEAIFLAAYIENTRFHFDNSRVSLIKSYFYPMSIIQVDHSGCAKPPIDIKTIVIFYYMGLILKQNFCFGVSGRFDTT